MPDFEKKEMNQEDTPQSIDPETAQTSTPETIGEALPDIESLMQALRDSQIKADEYLDGWQRSRADFANYKRRIEREQSQIYQNAAGNLIKRYLDILDDLERALKNRPKDGEGATLGCWDRINIS